MTGNRPAVRNIMEDSRKNPDRRAPGYYLAMPYIFREETKTKFERDYQEALRDYDGVLIRNLESLKWLQDREYKKAGPFRLQSICMQQTKQRLFNRRGTGSGDSFGGTEF